MFTVELTSSTRQ